MGDPIVIIVGDETGDRPLHLAMQHLCALSSRGFIRRFWFVNVNDSAGESPETWIVSEGEVESGSLFSSIASQQNPSITRMALAISADADERAIANSVAFHDELFFKVQSLQPSGIRLSDSRIAFPTEVHERSKLSVIFNSHADANLISIPIDRKNDLAFGVPISLEDLNRFGAHVAAELATQLGLWRGMETAAVDDSTPGVIAGNEIPICFSRSYVSASVGPPLPIREAMAAHVGLPIPPGLQASPNQQITANKFAKALFEDLEVVHFQLLESRREKDKRGRMELARIYIDEARSYVREIPSNIEGSLTDDFGELGGELLQRALGDESRYEVDWIGKDLNDASNPEDHLEAIIEGLNQRIESIDLDSVESTPIDQSNWARLVRDVTGAIDGSDQATTKIVIGGNRLVIDQPQVAGPDVNVEFEDCLKILSEEPLSRNSGTILGQFAAAARHEMDLAENRFQGQISRVRELYENLTIGRFRPLPVLTWSIGTLITIVLTALFLAFEIPNRLGVDSWSNQTRTVIGFSIAIIWLGIGGFCLAAAQRVQKGFEKYIPWIGWLVVLAIAAVLWWVVGTLSSPQFEFLSTPIRELIFIGAVSICLIIGIIASVLARRVGYRAMARLLGILLLTYLSLAVMGVLVRNGGWYSQQIQSEIRARCFQISILALILSLILFLILMYFRIRHRLAFDATKKELIQLIRTTRITASEIVRIRVAHHQYLGTALALNRIIHFPFGNFDDVDSNDERSTESFPAYKVSLNTFESDENSNSMLFAAIRKSLAERGWVLRQYLSASNSYFVRFAAETGRDPKDFSGSSPETDQTIGSSRPDFEKPGIGPRWSFAEVLYAGELDGALEQVGIEIIDRNIQDLVDLLSARDCGSGELRTLDSVGLDLISGSRPELPPSFFGGLATAGDPKAQLKSAIWWPETVSTPESLPPLTRLHRSPTTYAKHGQIVVEFARSDWSERFPLSEIPFGRGSSDSPLQEQRVDRSGGM